MSHRVPAALPDRAAYPRGLPVACAILALLNVFSSAADTYRGTAKNPSILICSPDGPGGLVGSHFLDLQYLRELRTSGFEPDFLDSDRDFTWDRIKNYNVIVIYNCPPAKPGPKGRRTLATSSHAPPHKEFLTTVERFLEAGGGVFLMVHTYHPGSQVRPLMSRGARGCRSRATWKMTRRRSFPSRTCAASRSSP